MKTEKFSGSKQSFTGLGPKDCDLTYINQTSVYLEKTWSQRCPI